MKKENEKAKKEKPTRRLVQLNIFGEQETVYPPRRTSAGAAVVKIN